MLEFQNPEEETGTGARSIEAQQQSQENVVPASGGEGRRGWGVGVGWEETQLARGQGLGQGIWSLFGK